MPIRSCRSRTTTRQVKSGKRPFIILASLPAAPVALEAAFLLVASCFLLFASGFLPLLFFSACSFLPVASCFLLAAFCFLFFLFLALTFFAVSFLLPVSCCLRSSEFSLLSVFNFLVLVDCAQLPDCCYLLMLTSP